MKGSGTPVTGSRPATAPTLIIACEMSQAVMPAASRLSKVVGAAPSHLGPDDPDGREQADHDQAARKTRLLANHGEDEIGVLVGEIAPGRNALAYPGPEPVPPAEGYESLDRLVTGGARVENG